MSNIESKIEKNGLEVAVIGMAGRFPGASNIDEFWENLEQGKESIAFLSEKEIEASGIDTVPVKHPAYVKSAGGRLETIEYFDADFFGYAPGDAEIMDPQMRIFHECVWTALEHAGYNPNSYNGLVGVYAGASNNFNWNALAIMSGQNSESESFAAIQFIGRDFLCTRVSHTLNLRGPTILVQSACSTSLVAIHLACQALLNGECDMALAGGVSVTTGKPSGYLFQEGMINSADGHCRAFDAKAEGTIEGRGAGVVVLKSLDEALEDGDYIYAVVKGTAINNDGSKKASYSAPARQGQTAAIRFALQAAEVEPESISYVETHGTGTALGDPIEIEALKQAFNTKKRGFCAVGSVKTNIGHLDAAASVTGFIKTVLALKYKLIPPSLHFEKPNPKIDFKNSPFYVNTTLSKWKNDKYPLRAGVNSLGLGGTNVHVILEEAPGTDDRRQSQGRGGICPPHRSRALQLIPLSAKTPSALDRMTQNLARFFKKNPVINLADAAYTLQTGRKAFEYRKILVCSSVEEAVEALENQGSNRVRTFSAKEEKSGIVFMFSGQGSQYVNMGLELYRNEPVFQEEMDRCFDILASIMGSVRDILYPGPTNEPEPGASSSREKKGQEKIDNAIYSGSIKFIFDYSMAKLLMKWGIKPDVMIGHSFGEYVAACLSGVFSLEDALRLVVLRGKLMMQMPEGSMLGVSVSEEDIKSYLNDDLSLAAVNTPSLCIVSGTKESVNTCEKKLMEKGHECIRINFPRASHSNMMEPILPEFSQAVSRVTLNKPRIPYISGMTGKLATDRQVTDPDYWAKHMRETVRFADGIAESIKMSSSIFIQVGAGRSLTLYVSQHPAVTSGHLVINLLKNRKEDMSDVFYLLDKIGDLWLWGQNINWEEFYPGEKRHRLALPTYPFEGQRYWKIVDDFQKNKDGWLRQVQVKNKKDIADWFFVPSWKPSNWPVYQPQPGGTPSQFCVMVFLDQCSLGEKLLERLEQENREIVRVRYDYNTEFIKVNDYEFILNPRRDDAYDTLFNELRALRKKPFKVLHLWGVTKKESAGKELDPDRVKKIQDLGFYSLINLVKAIEKQDFKEEFTIGVVTNNLWALPGEGLPSPAKATVIGPVRTIPAEYPKINCFSVDIVIPKPGSTREVKLLDRLTTQLMAKSSHRFIAYRGNCRLVEIFVPVQLNNSKELGSRVKEGGVYLIIGGLGGLGFVLAEHLAKTARAKLILVGRSAFPARSHWEKWLSNHKKNDDTSRKIRKIIELEELGARVLVLGADVANRQQLEEVAAMAEEKFGRINGVIHSAMMVDGAVISRRTREISQRVLAPKVMGTLVLDEIFRDKRLDFFVICSSVSAFESNIGEVGYCAANAFQDAYAHYRNSGDSDNTFTVSINWDAWQEVGQTVKTTASLSKRYNKDFSGYLAKYGILPGEGVDVFRRVLASDFSQVAVFTRGEERFAKELEPVENEKSSLYEEVEKVSKKGIMRKRPELKTEYVAAQDEYEKKLAAIWQEFFGFEGLGILDDFFQLGGDSLKATILISKIHEKLEVKIPLSVIFESPTIMELAKYIRGREKGKYASINPVEEKEYYPLSSAQKRMLILNRLKGNDTSDNTPGVMLVEGNLDKQRLEETLKMMIKRHDSLRTSFGIIDEGAIQIIHKEVDFRIDYMEAVNSQAETSLPVEEGEVCRYAGKFIRPFDLSEAPLFRVGLVELARDRHLILDDMHHIIKDGASTRIFSREFISLYYGVKLPVLRVQYKDFSAWQNNLLQSEVVKKQQEYWLNRFAGDIPVLNMPIDFPRPTIQSFAGDLISFTLSRDLVTKVKRMVIETGTTLYMLLLAIYTVLLSRYTGQEDIVVGTPIAGRPHADLENIIGMFVNTLAMRNFPKGEMTFREFLEEVKFNCLKAYENQDYQFEELVDRLNIKRDQSRSVLFDTMFDTQDVEIKTPHASSNINKGVKNLTFNTVPFEEKVTQFDIITHAFEAGETILFKLRYCTKLFKRESIEIFIDFFKEIIATVVDDYDIKLEDIKITHSFEAAEANIPKEDFDFSSRR